jgi:cell division protein FtsB
MSTDEAVIESLIEKIATDAEVTEKLTRRVELVVWVAIAMLVLAALSVVIRLVNYYGLRADVVARSQEVLTLTETNADLSHRVNKLRAEVAIRDARFQASKGVLKDKRELDGLLTIQSIVDEYALAQLNNGNAAGKTSDDVRREVCAQLSSRGYPCVP